MARLRKYLISGLLVWVPIWVTYVIIRFIVDLMDHTLALLPKAYHPETLYGTHIPGLGLLLTFILLLVTGLLVANFLGHWLMRLWEGFIGRIPFVRSIYNATKQIMQTVFISSGSEAFRYVYLVEYPRRGTWSLAFQTGGGSQELKEKISEDIVTLFVPTTPNPTSGYLIIVPREDATRLDMSVDDALKMVISLGVVQPGVPIDKSVVKIKSPN